MPERVSPRNGKNNRYRLRRFSKEKISGVKELNLNLFLSFFFFSFLFFHFSFFLSFPSFCSLFSLSNHFFSLIFFTIFSQDYLIFCFCRAPRMFSVCPPYLLIFRLTRFLFFQKDIVTHYFFLLNCQLSICSRRFSLVSYNLLLGIPAAFFFLFLNLNSSYLLLFISIYFCLRLGFSPCVRGVRGFKSSPS